MSFDWASVLTLNGPHRHKWLCAPKGAGFLYVRRDLQATSAPPVISWGYEGEATFLARHEKQGTRDPAAFLSIPTAIEWQRAHDWDAVRERCRALAARTPARLGLDAYGSGLQMVSMRLPAGAPPDLRERLYTEHRIEIPTWETGTIRASFQGYNDDRDLDALADALSTLLASTRAGG